MGIVRASHDSCNNAGESCDTFLTPLAQAAGHEMLAQADLASLDRQRPSHDSNDT